MPRFERCKELPTEAIWDNYKKEQLFPDEIAELLNKLLQENFKLRLENMVSKQTLKVYQCVFDGLNELQEELGCDGGE